jgi:hypothetical protein
MRVKFEFTPEDQIDASKRFLARSKVISFWRWKGLGYTALLTWLLVFSFFTYFYEKPQVGALLGIVAVGLSALMYPSSHERAVGKRLRKLLQEQFGNADGFLCEVELTSDGVSVRQMKRQVMYEWASVAEIQETKDSINIFTRDGGGVIVRDRAFSTPAEKREFLELARASLNSACS